MSRRKGRQPDKFIEFKDLTDLLNVKIDLSKPLDKTDPMDHRLIRIEVANRVLQFNPSSRVIATTYWGGYFYEGVSIEKFKPEYQKAILDQVRGSYVAR
jgi:hypothetical protein